MLLARTCAGSILFWLSFCEKGHEAPGRHSFESRDVRDGVAGSLLRYPA